MVEGILEHKKEDTRKCQIYGKSFDGVTQTMSKTKGTVKLLYVHGVGDHSAGYSMEFMEKLSKKLGLNRRSENYKEISLINADFPGKPLGTLRIYKLNSRDNSKKNLIFHELTWSEITREEKKLLAYDNSGEYSFRRANFNNAIKKFSNDTSPDPMIYLGKRRQEILTSFIQSFCWMGTNEWKDIPDKGTHQCLSANPKSFKNIDHDDYIFVSHSLGSRIAIDGLQYIASLFEEGLDSKDKEKFNNLHKILKKKELKMFMLSNQLPMLQLGRDDPEVFNEIPAYCNKDGSKWNDRMFKKTSITAFSDPNDILSYAIPKNFTDRYLDSRICPSITNILINISHVSNLLGFGEFANPMQAHISYDKDDRVVSLIANGVHSNDEKSLKEKRCEWTELKD
ncbi:MAG: hypothetical protein ACJAW3_001061 [Lentimonas sp.]|jgi:hypothetical protein